MTAEARRSPRLELQAKVPPASLGPARALVESLYGSRKSKPNVAISLSSEIPVGAGLGSSAAAMVAITGAVSALEGWDLQPVDLAEAAGAGEKLVHGNPSGIDAATSALGGVIEFKRGLVPRTIVVSSSVELLVVFSGRRRSTGRLISKVGETKAAYPSLFNGLTEGATIVSRLSAEALAAGDARTLGRLMTYSHAVLGRVGASTKRLDSLVDLCMRSGCLGAKLTGAGGGGSVVAVPPPKQGRQMLKKLTSKGYEAFLTSVPAAGARSWTE